MKIIFAIIALTLISCNAKMKSLVSYPVITKIEKQGDCYTVWIYSKEIGKLAASFERLPNGYREGRRIIVRKIDSCYMYLKPLLK